jgi:hypothetical protein
LRSGENDNKGALSSLIFLDGLLDVSSFTNGEKRLLLEVIFAG